jgi:salicylate hydroxylase
MTNSVLIAGGGIGGLAAAVALSRSGVSVELMEQAERFSEMGAGIQLGPNAVRVLDAWGLKSEVLAVASRPERVQARDAHSGRALSALPLAGAFEHRYGHPYLTVHRADLHRLLFAAVQAVSGVHLHLGTRVQAVDAQPNGVRVQTEQGGWVASADAFIAADGVRSQLRLLWDRDDVAQPTGHLAYRSLLPVADAPEGVELEQVTAWLGPRMHVVTYPVRNGRLLNVVVVVQGLLPSRTDQGSWNRTVQQADLMRVVGHVYPALERLLAAVQNWTFWALHDRPPEPGPEYHAQGRVAWLGDAAHPMRPYLAQGAAMALEDAWTLGELAQGAGPADWPAVLARYADLRWERNARVQAAAVRSGEIFHASGPLRWARNLALSLAGARIMDRPWLYSGPPSVDSR